MGVSRHSPNGCKEDSEGGNGVQMEEDSNQIVYVRSASSALDVAVTVADSL